MGETAPFWRFSAASYPDLEEKAINTAVKSAKRSITRDSGSSSVSEDLFLEHSTDFLLTFFPMSVLSCT